MCGQKPTQLFQEDWLIHTQVINLIRKVSGSSYVLFPKEKYTPTQIETPIGTITLTPTDVVILAKVGFLLDPQKIFDSVFMNQLTPRLRRVLEDEYKAQKKEI